MRAPQTVQLPHLFSGAGGTRALGGPARLPAVLGSRPETSPAWAPGKPPPRPRSAGTKSPTPYKPAISLTARRAGILKNGSRCGSLVTPPPARQAPAWETPALTPPPPASQCSRTCGGGTQNRRVTCRQLLTDGSFLSLSDELCQGPKASSHKSCARTDCPPHFTVGDWSKVRATPGLTGPASRPSFLSATGSSLPGTSAGTRAASLGS